MLGKFGPSKGETHLSQQTTFKGPARARISRWLGTAWDWFLEDPARHLLAGLAGAVVIGLSQSFLLGPATVALAAVGLRQAGSPQGNDSPGSSWSAEVQQDLAASIRFLVPGLLSGLLIVCFSLVGLVFLIVPGIVIFSMYLFTSHFIVDQRHDFWEAMESSRQLAGRDYLSFTLFGATLLALNLLGIAFFVVGSVFTLSLTHLAITAAYLDCTDGERRPPSAAPEPAVHIE